MAGAAPLMTPTATIVHHGGRSTKARSKRIVYVIGGRIGYIHRYFSPFWRGFSIGFTIFWVWWRATVYSLIAKLSPRWREAANEWSSAWEKRDLWLSGPPKSGI
jgi:hypothetical protein